MEMDDRRTMKGIDTAPDVVEDRGKESAGGEESESGNVDSVGQSQSPAEEEIGEDGNRWVRVGSEPLDNGFLEIGQGIDYGNVAVVSEVLDVFDAGRYFRVRRKGED